MTKEQRETINKLDKIMDFANETLGEDAPVIIITATQMKRCVESSGLLDAGTQASQNCYPEAAKIMVLEFSQLLAHNSMIEMVNGQIPSEQ